MFDVLIRVWDPITDKFGREETKANTMPLTKPEAASMVAELLPCVDDYHGQGMTIHSVRKVLAV